MTEHGVFEDGLCVEDGFHGETGKAAAEVHAADLRAFEPGCEYTVEEICPDHPEQPKNACEDCATDEPDQGFPPGPCTECDGKGCHWCHWTGRHAA